MIAKNSPIMISIGNGYLPNGKFSSILQKIVGHWITIWGYNDREQVFYVYDSGLSSTAYDSKVPIGNASRRYTEILRDWGAGIFPWPRGSLYITVKA